ncbi:MAG: hypothetical protein HYZ50_26445 [Deltaproteobacteria bacterium]|nr:hypothetical protein [Deltaproteobacteria bacterium]
MTLEQIQQLPELAHDETGTLQSTYTIYSTSQIELVARWQGRAISFHVANESGLYAVSIDMILLAAQHTPIAADQEILDLEQCAPIRFAVLQKYGRPQGLSPTWDATEISPFLLSSHETGDLESQSRAWPYARNWLIWEGQETRLALGERSVWYASRLGLAKRERVKKEREEERNASLSRMMDQRARRQRKIEEAREAMPLRAHIVDSLF